MPDTSAELCADGGRSTSLSEVPLYLSVKQLTARYSVHYTTVWRWVREAGFPQPVRFSDNCTRWRLADVEDWESRRIAEVNR